MDEEREGRGRPEQEQVGANPPTLLAEEMADDGDGDVDAATEEDVAAHELCK